MARLVSGVLGTVCFAAVLLGDGIAGEALASVGRQQAIDNLLAGRFKWKVSSPLVSPLQRPADFTYSVKDPTIVRYKGRWHLFCTIRGKQRSHQIEYFCFEDWKKVKAGTRQILKLSDGYFCAPQVLYLRPHKKWYLICQASDESWEPKYGASYATTTDIGDASSWSKLRPLGHKQADGKAGLDFWVICGDAKAYLFFTTLDGRMWREETALADFPMGWSEPILAIRGDIFEASHIYLLKGLNKYLTVVEAQAGGRRYYKAYLAERLDGEWKPLAATREKPFASPVNTQDSGEHWTDSFSHGELIRAGFDETLVVDPAELKFLFQGVDDEAKRGKKYGEIPWRLGMLTPVK